MNLQLYRKAFWLAVTLTVAAWLLPFGNLAIYPFSVLATWAHEMGHGLAAIISGGSFVELKINSDLSGLATTTSAGAMARAFTSAGGLVGAPLCGAVIVALGFRAAWSRWLLWLFSALLVLSTLIWVRSGFGVASLSVLAALGWLAGWKLSDKWRFVLVQLLGVQLSLSALRGADYLFSPGAVVNAKAMPSDVSAISAALGGPYWLWGALILLFNLATLYGAYRLVRRRLAREA